MATYNGKSYQDPKNINLRGGTTGTGLIRWAQAPFKSDGTANNWATNPFSSTEVGLYISAAGVLSFSYLGSVTALGSGGGGGSIPTWLQIFNANNTFALAGTTWTVDNTTGNNNVLTLTNSGAGTGNVVQITNVGTGKDINGTSNSWSVSKTGAAVFLSVATPTIAATGALAITASGSNAITIGSGSNTITLAVATTFSAGVTINNIIVGSTSNTVADFIETNNTATTIGTGVSSLGLAVIRSTSLTTGNALLVQLAEGTLTTGFYFNAWDSVGVASVFSIGSKGATVIAGSAYATAALTISAGDLVVSAGKINHTAVGATTANGFTGTYNGLTTGIGMSLVHTTAVITTGSVFSVSSTSVDTGTAQGTLVNLVSSASTVGTIVQLTANALVTGHAFTISSSGVVTTTGDLFSVIGNSATTSTGLVRVSATGMTTGTTVSITGGGANQTSAGIVLGVIMGASTVGIGEQITTTGVYTGAGIWQLIANSATTGTIGSISATGLTSGIGLLVTGGGANMLTAGIALSIALGAATTGAGLSVVTTGVYTGSGTLLVTANSATTGTLAVVSGTGLTTGVGIKVVATAATLTTGFYFAANDSALNVLTIGANGHITSNQTTAPTVAVGTQAGITAAAITAGSTDVCGTITTTGTSTGGTILTVTFNKTYTIAPKAVIITAANAAGGGVNTDPIVTQTATGFTLTIPSSGTYAATPSWTYAVIA